MKLITLRNIAFGLIAATSLSSSAFAGDMGASDDMGARDDMGAGYCSLSDIHYPTHEVREEPRPHDFKDDMNSCGEYQKPHKYECEWVSAHDTWIYHGDEMVVFSSDHWVGYNIYSFEEIRSRGCKVPTKHHNDGWNDLVMEDMDLQVELKDDHSKMKQLYMGSSMCSLDDCDQRKEVKVTKRYNKVNHKEVKYYEYSFKYDKYAYLLEVYPTKHHKEYFVVFKIFKKDHNGKYKMKKLLSSAANLQSSDTMDDM